MSGPLTILAGRPALVGSFGVQRVLPGRGRRTVGAWCFVDHMGPGQVTERHGLDIGPHPHIGLQTVTWLLRGEVLHRDSLGSEQVIRPGQLNLMTAGHGVSHSEEATGSYRGELHGVQLWVAQPDATRHGPAAFEHHDYLPQVGLGGGTATVMVGAFAGVSSPARCDTAHMGADLALDGGPVRVTVDRSFEHGLVVLEGSAVVYGQHLGPGQLGYLAPGAGHIQLDAQAPARVLLIGGIPFPEPVVMWWNYVARSREEIAAAHRDWTDEDARFGKVCSPLPRIETGPPPWRTSDQGRS